MKKIIKAFSILTLIMSLVSINCDHIHNDECGYDNQTQTGCTHQHDISCGAIDPLDWYDPDGPKN